MRSWVGEFPMNLKRNSGLFTSALSLEVCRCLWGRMFGLQTSKLLFVLSGELRSRYGALESSHTSRKCHSGCLLGWAVPHQLQGRAHPDKTCRVVCAPTFGMDSAFMHIYFKLCIQMCGFLEGIWEEGRNVAVRNVLSHSHRDPEENSLLFPACPDGLCVWVVSSGSGCRAL